MENPQVIDQINAYFTCAGEAFAGLAAECDKAATAIREFGAVAMKADQEWGLIKQFRHQMRLKLSGKNWRAAK